MNPDFFSSILWDGLMAAIAATGFAVISNPPKRAIAVSALLAAVGHAFRFYMMHSWSIDISSATFIAAFTIGMLGVLTAKLVMPRGNLRLPLPPADDSRRVCLQDHSGPDAVHAGKPGQETMNRLIVDICKNGITAFFIIFSLVIGIAIPLLMFKRLNYTHIIRPRN